MNSLNHYKRIIKFYKRRPDLMLAYTMGVKLSLLQKLYIRLIIKLNLNRTYWR